MNEWLSTEEHRWFEPTTSVVLQKIEYQKYLELTIGIPHNRLVDVLFLASRTLRQLPLTATGKIGEDELTEKPHSTPL